MKRGTDTVPRLRDGKPDKEKVKALFFESKHIAWPSFCDEQGWDHHVWRSSFPVRTWQDEKRRRTADAQCDIILHMIHERKFVWTKDILGTLERYPKLIDAGMKLAEAKMAQLVDLAEDYAKWRKTWPDGNRPEGKSHPWENAGLEVQRILSALNQGTEAKMRALMLDKWAPAKLDIPAAELDPPDPTGEEAQRGRLTVEGKAGFSFDDIGRWFENYMDKPTDPVTVHSTGEKKADSQPGAQPGAQTEDRQKDRNESGQTVTPSKVAGVEILDDQGRPIGGS